MSEDGEDGGAGEAGDAGEEGRAGGASPRRAPGGRAGRSADPTATFAGLAIGAAALAFVVAVLGVVGVIGGRADPGGAGRDGGVAPPGASGAAVDLDDGAVADPSATAADVAAAAADAMGAVTSVEFRVGCEGAPVHIDRFGRIALTSLIGQFAVPSRAQAELSVTIDGDLSTRLGAVAVDDEIWLSNPVTGDFETLPEGYDIDPSRFFDPAGGWRPLLAGLVDVTLVGVDDRGGDRYHLRGTATAEQMGDVTAGLVGDQDVVVDLWVHPSTYLVTAGEFATTTPDGVIEWTLELARYGERFRIEPPANVRPAATTTPSSTIPGG